MSRTYIKNLDRAKEILNHTILELYGLKGISNYQIIFLLELYANNIKENTKKEIIGDNQ